MTTTAVAPVSFISRAVSRIVVPGETTAARVRISEPTGWCAGSRPFAARGGRASPSASPRVVSSERATKPTLSGRASTRSAAS